LFEAALTDYIKSSTSALCYANAKKLRRYMKENPERYPDLPDDQKLGSMLRDFFFMRPTIYDARRIREGTASVSDLHPLWVDKKFNVIGMSE